MARLPQPGSDDGTWGDVLNEYLLTEHNADGTHKDAAFIDASDTAKGKIQLTGDLGGTADSPSVVSGNATSLQGVAIDPNAQVLDDQQVLVYASGPGKWVNSYALDLTTNAATINGIPVDGSPPSDGNTLVYDQTSNIWQHVTASTLPTDHLGTASDIMLKYHTTGPNQGAFWDTLGNDLPTTQTIHYFDCYYDTSSDYVLQGVASDGDVVLLLPSSSFDDSGGSLVIGSTTQFITPTFGLFHFEFRTEIAALTNCDGYFGLLIDGNEIPVHGANVTSLAAGDGYQVAADLYLNDSQTVEVVLHLLSGTYDVTLTGPMTRFSGRLITGPNPSFI